MTKNDLFQEKNGWVLKDPDEMGYEKDLGEKGSMEIHIEKTRGGYILFLLQSNPNAKKTPVDETFIVWYSDPNLPFADRDEAWECIKHTIEKNVGDEFVIDYE